MMNTTFCTIPLNKFTKGARIFSLHIKTLEHVLRAQYVRKTKILHFNEILQATAIRIALIV